MHQYWYIYRCYSALRSNMRAIFLIIAVMFINRSCNEQVLIPLPDHDVFKFSEGDTLVYKNSDNDIEEAIVDLYTNRIWGPSWDSWNKYVYEHIQVQLYFIHDQAHVEKYDSLENLQLECVRDNSWDHCDSIYNYYAHHMYVDFRVESEDPRYNMLKWKKLPKYNLNDLKNSYEIVLQGETYKRVFILERDPEFLDSLIQVKRIFFNFEFGILKYEKMDSSTYELQF